MDLGLKAVAHDPSRIDPADARHVARSALGATHPFQVLLACMRSIPAGGLETIDVPVHLVFAGKDLVIPPRLYSSYFIDRIPHAEVTTLENLGHCPQVEEPAGDRRPHPRDRPQARPGVARGREVASPAAGPSSRSCRSGCAAARRGRCTSRGIL